MAAKLTPHARKLLTWHAEELEDVLEGIDSDDLRYDAIKTKADQAWDDLGITIVEVTE